MKDKPQEKIKHLFCGLWTILFSSVWEQRNSLLHSEENIVARYEKEQLIQDLHEWKRCGAARVGASQVYLIHYDCDQLHEWTLTSLRNMSELLLHAARNYRERTAGKLQATITSYFSSMVETNSSQGTIQIEFPRNNSSRPADDAVTTSHNPSS